MPSCYPRPRNHRVLSPSNDWTYFFALLGRFDGFHPWVVEPHAVVHILNPSVLTDLQNLQRNERQTESSTGEDFKTRGVLNIHRPYLALLNDAPNQQERTDPFCELGCLFPPALLGAQSTGGALPLTSNSVYRCETEYPQRLHSADANVIGEHPK